VSIADPDRYARRLREIIKAAHATGRGPGQ
jgi:hypothetical protein